MVLCIGSLHFLTQGIMGSENGVKVLGRWVKKMNKGIMVIVDGLGAKTGTRTTKKDQMFVFFFTQMENEEIGTLCLKIDGLVGTSRIAGKFCAYISPIHILSFESTLFRRTKSRGF